MRDSAERFRRGDPRARAERDIDRIERREPAGRFWRSVALIGSVGWPIVLLATGGAVGGRYLDTHWSTGVRFTLMLLFIGTVLGTGLAFRSIRGNGR
jgi:predicted F0F1-ATPase subunit